MKEEEDPLLWIVGDWFAKWGGVALYLRVMACSSFWIAKLSKSSTLRIF